MDSKTKLDNDITANLLTMEDIFPVALESFGHKFKFHKIRLIYQNYIQFLWSSTIPEQFVYLSFNLVIIPDKFHIAFRILGSTYVPDLYGKLVYTINKVREN